MEKEKGGKKLGLNRKIRLISCSVDYNTQWSLVISILRCRTEEVHKVYNYTMYGIFKNSITQYFIFIMRLFLNLS